MQIMKEEKVVFKLHNMCVIVETKKKSIPRWMPTFKKLRHLHYCAKIARQKIHDWKDLGETQAKARKIEKYFCLFKLVVLKAIKFTSKY